LLGSPLVATGFWCSEPEIVCTKDLFLITIFVQC
jgi:hypothetical protein